MTACIRKAMIEHKQNSGDLKDMLIIAVIFYKRMHNYLHIPTCKRCMPTEVFCIT